MYCEIFKFLFRNRDVTGLAVWTRRAVCQGADRLYPVPYTLYRMPAYVAASARLAYELIVDKSPKVCGTFCVRIGLAGGTADYSL